MNNTDETLDYLFSQARLEVPEAKLEETKKAFIAATLVAAGGIAVSSGFLKLLTLKKWIIMISTISIISTGALIVGLNSNTPDHKTSSSITAVNTEKNVIDESKPITDHQPESRIISYTETIEQEKQPLLIDSVVTEQVEQTSESEIIKPATTGPTKKEVIVQNKEAITPYNMRLDITESTTEKDFAEIKKKATAAGIKFSHKAKYKGDKLVKLNLELKLKNSDNGQHEQHISSNFNVKGDFAYTLAWKTAKDGSACEMFWGDTEDFDNNDRSQSQEGYEHYLVDLDLSAMMQEIDSLTAALSDESSELWIVLSEEMKDYADEITAAMNEIDREELERAIQEISASSADLGRIISEEVEEALKEVEKAMKEVEKEREEAEKTKKEEENKRKKDKEEK